jgi:hypothetical protein
MRNPFYGETALYQSLLAEDAQLSGLVTETRYVVRRVARQGYAGLNKQPGGDTGVSRLRGSDAPDSRFFKQKYNWHLVPLPSEPVVMPGNDACTITETVSERAERVHRFGKGLTVRLPRVYREVSVTVERNIAEGRTDHARFALSVGGYASHNLRYDHTHPSGKIANPGKPQHNAYTNPDELRADYASAYSGALAVTGLVAASLELAHGITTDSTSIVPLLDAWQHARGWDPRGAINQNLVPYLPHDIAAHAGALPPANG